MTGVRRHGIWREQCAAAEAVRPRFRVHLASDRIAGEKPISFAGATADNPAFARVLPQSVSRLRHMFTRQGIRTRLDRIEHRRRGRGEATKEDSSLPFKHPEAAARRARQFAPVKELLTAPALGTS